MKYRNNSAVTNATYGSLIVLEVLADCLERMSSIYTDCSFETTIKSIYVFIIPTKRSD